jgi:hypothetical protein
MSLYEPRHLPRATVPCRGCGAPTEAGNSMRLWCDACQAAKKREREKARRERQKDATR